MLILFFSFSSFYVFSPFRWVNSFLCVVSWLMFKSIAGTTTLAILTDLESVCLFCEQIHVICLQPATIKFYKWVGLKTRTEVKNGDHLVIVCSILTQNADWAQRFRKTHLFIKVTKQKAKLATISSIKLSEALIELKGIRWTKTAHDMHNKKLWTESQTPGRETNGSRWVAGQEQKQKGSRGKHWGADDNETHRRSTN